VKLARIALMGAGLASFCFACFAQRTGGSEEPSWAPKLIEIPKYVAPHKPVTRLADLKKQHAAEANWHQVIVDDGTLHGEYIQSAPGTKVSRRFHPDTREFWAVMAGQLKFEIEGQQPFVATKGSLVQVPMQTLYSIETAGDEPALRYEVNIPHAKTFYPIDVKPPEMPGFKWIEARLNRKPGAYGPGNQPHANLFELAKDPKFRGRPFVTDDRSFANIIYGYERELPPLDTKNPGHYHPESSESWLIMTGQIRYPIEGQGVIIADEGDIVYVPLFTFHAPRYHGPGPSCRLAMNGYPNIAHVRHARTPD
jgi:mannose-6-phosphate isomerase-like protein (cupin superfamily)